MKKALIVLTGLILLVLSVVVFACSGMSCKECWKCRGVGHTFNDEGVRIECDRCDGKGCTNEWN